MSTLALFPDSTDAQCTPRDLAIALGRFSLDPCSSPRSHVQADTQYMLEAGQDGLSLPWFGSVYCNGPYSDPLPWCLRLAAHDGPWCSLWKLDPTTRWFTALANAGASWGAFRKRLRFERPGNVGCANFPSVLVWRDWMPSNEVLALLWRPA